MSRVSDLEKKVDALERNVGMLAKEAGLDDCLKIAEYSSIVHYKEGYKEGTEYSLKQEEVKELERELERRRRELEAQFTSNEEKHEISWGLICKMFDGLMKLLNVNVIIDYCDSSNIMTIIDVKTQSKIIEISLDDLSDKILK